MTAGPGARTGGRRAERSSERGRRGGLPTPVQYLLGAVVGALAAPAVAGGVWMVILFYGDWLADWDTQNDRLSEVIAGSVLAAPFLGLVLGIAFVAWRRRKARRTGAPNRAR